MKKWKKEALKNDQEDSEYQEIIAEQELRL